MLLAVPASAFSSIRCVFSAFSPALRVCLASRRTESISMYRPYLSLLLGLAAPSAFVHAAEDAVPELETTVVTANRFESSTRETGSSITVITADEIKKRQVLTVADALRLVPGLDVLNSGGMGRMTSVYTRGAGSGQTLVLIDMVEMNDPSSPVAAFDFANLMVDNIERIEILRGGESALYGSEAIGGVINIVTKKGKGRPRVNLNAQGGSYDTFKVQGSATGEIEDFNYSAAASETQTHGWSAADYLWDNPERDWYRNTTFDGRAGYQALESLDLGVNLRYNHGKNALDYMFGDPIRPNAPTDALHYTNTTSELYTRGFAHFSILDNLWEQTLGIGYSDINREYRNDDPTLLYDLSGNYLGSKIKGDWQNIFHLHEKNILTLGLEDEEDTLENDSEGIGGKSYNTQGYYLSDQFDLFDRSATTASVRYSENNRSGSKVTWSVTESLKLNQHGTRLKANYGTGFKVPTLYELYAPFYGNPDLAPETSRNWDAGLEQNFAEQNLLMSATFFSNQFNNLIQANPANNWIADNINQATAEGVEALLQWNPTKDLTLRANYTFNSTLNKETGLPLVNRPRDKGNFELNYRFLENADINVVVIAVGEKEGINDMRVPAYAIANLAGSYRINEYVKLFARIDNVFNKEYQEVYGYGTTRLAGYGGVSLTY